MNNQNLLLTTASRPTPNNVGHFSVKVLAARLMPGVVSRDEKKNITPNE